MCKDIEEVVKYILEMSEPKWHIRNFIESYLRADGTLKEESVKDLSRDLTDFILDNYCIDSKLKPISCADWRLDIKPFIILEVEDGK